MCVLDPDSGSANHGCKCINHLPASYFNAQDKVKKISLIIRCDRCDVQDSNDHQSPPLSNEEG